MTNQTLMIQSPIKHYTTLSVDDLMQQVNRIMLNYFSCEDDISSKDNLCIEALKYHFKSTGSQYRAKSCLYACMKLSVNYDDMLILSAVCELLHNASLIHDDIQDKDENRRGQQSVWKKFGENIAICAGDLLISTAYGVLSRYSKPSHLPKLISTINHQIQLAIKGQSLDLCFKQNEKISIDSYLNICKQKSGALLCLPLELALISAERFESIALAKEACDAFSISYQILDDLEDVVRDGENKYNNHSLNIAFILNNVRFEDTNKNAFLLCEHYLDIAIDYGSQLPNQSGDYLVDLASKLRKKVSYQSL